MSVDATILRIAERQLGLVTLGRLENEGLSRRQIYHRLRSGLLAPVHPGVYRTAGDVMTLAQRALAACLAAGDDAFASHLTAASLSRLIPGGEVPVEITVPASKRVRLAGVTAHRSATVGPGERARCGVVPVSAPGRTLIDIAGRLTRAELESATDEAIRQRLITPQRLLGLSRRRRFANRDGIAVLLQLARDRVGDGTSESELETKLFAVLRRYGLPRPVRQHEVVVRGRTVRFDLAYPDQRVAIESNGWAPHYGRDRWQSDHDRRNVVELSEWLVLEFTWSDVVDRPLYVAMTIADALGIHPTRWSALPVAR